MGKVLLVFCFDTEGPYTDPNYYDPKQLLGNWQSIDRVFLSKLFSKEFRYKYLDSEGCHFVASWFFLNWIGYKTYPVKHDVGYHKVFDHYKNKWGKQLKEFGDELGWHYHIPPINGVGNEWGTDWHSTNMHTENLCRMLIDREFFPNIYRAGGTIEDDVQSNWLEEWIPFDYSNRNEKSVNWNKKEADGRRIKDLLPWKKAPSLWHPYHPSFKDLTKKGSMNRLILKSLDLKSKVHTMTREKVFKVFESVKSRDIIFSVFEHDFRDRSKNILQFLSWVSKASTKTGVKFYYCGAAEAVKKYYKWELDRKLRLNVYTPKNKVLVKSNEKLFNKQPFLGIKYSRNIYNWKTMYKVKENVWEYNLLKEDLNKVIGIGAHDLQGNTFTKVIKL